MEAYPAAVSFRWFFNSSEYEEWKGHEEFSQTGLKSELQFLPKTSKDYGTLFCIGENAIGRQEEACVFQVREDVLIPLLTCLCRSCQRASRPPSPAVRSSTRLLPPSKSSVRKVNLVAKRKFSLFSQKKKHFQGFDGGLPANFLLELYHAEKMELKSQVTNKVPIFEVR